MVYGGGITVRRKKNRKGRKKIDWSKIRWGTLTAWLKRHRAAIKRKYGDPFTRKGEINDRVLRRLYKDKRFIRKLARSHVKRIENKIRFKLYVLRR